MELFIRKNKLIAKHLPNHGTEFKREFTFTNSDIRVSFIVPINKIEETNFFKIKYKDIADKGIVNDVVLMKEEEMDLDNMQIITTDKNIKYAKLTYIGFALELDRTTTNEIHLVGFDSLRPHMLATVPDEVTNLDNWNGQRVHTSYIN